MSGPHLRPKDLAERWQMSSKTLARWRWAGEGPRFLKVSGKVLYRKEDVREFEAAHLRRRTDEAIAVAAHSLTPKRGQTGVLGERLAEDAITRLVNREIKRWSAVGTSMREQRVLPGMLAHVRADLPAAISVPSAEDADEDDPIYRPLFGQKCATVGELRAAVAALWKGIADDRRKAEALTQLLDLLISTGAGGELPVSEAL
jgi:hypothetical protein